MKKASVLLPLLAAAAMLFNGCQLPLPQNDTNSSNSEESPAAASYTPFSEYSEKEAAEMAESRPDLTPTPAPTPSPADFILPEGNTLSQRIQTPEGYARTEAKKGSLGDFLRSYAMEPDQSPVLYYDGSEKPDQNGHAAVFSMPLAEGDLQQCADSVLRIYAEYFRQIGQTERMKFHFVNGFSCGYDRWKQGNRVVFSGNDASWSPSAKASDSEESFEAYLRILFAYASTLSLEEESKPIELSQLEIGDIFIKAGSPGHVVIAADLCESPDGRKAFLLAQGYMPAQSFHIIKNPAHPEDPWYYEEEVSYPFRTQSYTFPEGSLMRPSY